jgi:transposase IS481 family protein
MSHSNTRLTLHGRRLLIRRVREQGWAVAHAARAMGISRQCPHRRANDLTSSAKPGCETAHRAPMQHSVCPTLVPKTSAPDGSKADCRTRLMMIFLFIV